MSAVRGVTRLAAMDGEELRFRLACEARKVVGRLRFKVSPPRLDRSALARILNPDAGSLIAAAIAAARRGDALGAHRALALHFQTRASRWPLQASRRDLLVEEIRRAFPDAAHTAQRRADRLLDGRHDVLGYRDVRVGNPPDWHADAIHGRRAPLAHWTCVPYLDPAIGDHKIIWETNRHQYWLTLGTAYWLTGDPRYRAAVVAQLADWIRANPPLAGVNWASMLELAFRTLSWTWAVEFFCGESASDETPWLVDLLLSLDAQLTHVRENLSTYFSPNTHISGEGLALYAVSIAFPELRESAARAAHGRSVLLREAKRQVRGDGGHAELSSHYHRYSTDFYLLALMLARASGDSAAATLEDVARRQAVFLRTIADDRGHLPMIGDDDGGRLFGFETGDSGNASITLGVAASLLADPSLAVAPPREEEYWILGTRPPSRPVRGGPAPWPSRVLADSGYFVSRGADGSHLIFDAGPHGFLNGGHAHSDALSVVLRVAGEPVLVDPGTGAYTIDPATRNLFRSSRMHNTLRLDGRDHAVPAGPFHWHARADARMLVARTEDRIDFAAGTHDAYLPCRHVRAVLAMRDIGWLIADRVTGPDRLSAETYWHLHPSWTPVQRGTSFELLNATGTGLSLAFTAADLAVIEHDVGVAPEYGRLERGITIRAGRQAQRAVVLAAFVPSPRLCSASPAIAETDAPAAAPGWAATAFAIRCGHDAFTVTLAFPDNIAAEPSLQNWPQPCIEPLPTSCVG
jgi:hypothetical protein